MEQQRGFSAWIACSFVALVSQAQPAIEWQRCFGGTDEDGAECVEQTADGGYIVVGSTVSQDGDVTGHHGSRDIWVLKLDELGGLEWQRCYGGSADEVVRSIHQLDDGGYVLTGGTASNDGDVSGNHGEFDAWVLRIATDGSVEWQTCLGGSDDEHGRCLRSTSDAAYILSADAESHDGDVSGTHDQADAWLVKLDGEGDLEWENCLGGTLFEDARAIEQTADDGYAFIGTTSSVDGDVAGLLGQDDLWLVKTNAAGELQWQKCLGGTDWDTGDDIRLTMEGGYVLAGTTRSNDGDVSGNHGQGDAWVVKLDAAGEVQWQRCVGGTGEEFVFCIRQTDDGAYVMAGGSGSDDGDISGGHGGGDFFLAKLDPGGDLLWQTCLGGTGNDNAISVRPTADGGYIAVGNTDSNDGDVSGAHGDFDLWVVKLGPDDDTGIGAFAGMGLGLSPNPARSIVGVNVPDELSGSELSIMDALGRQVRRVRVSSGRQDMDVSRLARGCYLMKLGAQRSTLAQRLVLE